MKRWSMFAGVTAGTVLGTAWGITRLVPRAAVTRAVWVSAGVALVVQLGAFTLARAAQPANVVAGWGAGMLLRMLALAIYGLLVVRALGLEMQPALLSLAGFFFITTVIEPVFLKP